jgi:hypothetical protein
MRERGARHHVVGTIGMRHLMKIEPDHCFANVTIAQHLLREDLRLLRRPRLLSHAVSEIGKLALLAIILDAGTTAGRGFFCFALVACAAVGHY